MKIRFSQLSKSDYAEAIKYYKSESVDLSIRFKNDIKQSVNRIQSFPNLYPKINDRVQKCVVSKFPYTVFYTIFKNIIYILAIANHYKNPNSYIDRLNENI
ncbi:MAG: hypothetical protein DRG78_21395 [Epsilonproteobacteria bacterium]|nr:MAG: hypothetical protein DRG78_21395 [Campylobacterota bacterium]